MLLRLAASPGLPRRQTKPRGKLPGSLEHADVTNAGNQRSGCEWSDAGNLGDREHLLILAKHLSKAPAQLVYVFLDQVDSLELFLHAQHNHFGQRGVETPPLWHPLSVQVSCDRDRVHCTARNRWGDHAI